MEEWEKLARVRRRNNLDRKMSNCRAPTQNHLRCSGEFQIFSLWKPIYDQSRGGGSFPTESEQLHDTKEMETEPRKVCLFVLD